MRKVTALFCDDVRREEGNKMSYMGVYDAKLMVPSFPHVMPRLSAVIMVSTAKDALFKDLRLVIRKNDESFAEIAVPSEDLLAQQNRILERSEGGSEDSEIAIKMVLMLNNVMFEGETLLKVRVYTEAEELKGQGLRVTDKGIEETKH